MHFLRDTIVTETRRTFLPVAQLWFGLTAACCACSAGLLSRFHRSWPLQGMHGPGPGAPVQTELPPPSSWQRGPARGPSGGRCSRPEVPDKDSPPPVSAVRGCKAGVSVVPRAGHTLSWESGLSCLWLLCADTAASQHYAQPPKASVPFTNLLWGEPAGMACPHICRVRLCPVRGSVPPSCSHNRRKSPSPKWHRVNWS